MSEGHLRAASRTCPPGIDPAKPFGALDGALTNGAAGQGCSCSEEPFADLCTCRCGPSRADAARAALLCCQGSGRRLTSRTTVPVSAWAGVVGSCALGRGSVRISGPLTAHPGPPVGRSAAQAGRSGPVTFVPAENSVPVAGQFTLGSGLRGCGPRPVCTRAGVPRGPEVLAGVWPQPQGFLNAPTSVGLVSSGGLRPSSVSVRVKRF